MRELGTENRERKSEDSDAAGAWRVVLADEAIDEGGESFAGAGQDKFLELGIPVEFEAGGGCRDPDLANRRVGRDDEAGRGILEEDVEHAALLLDFETCLLAFLACDEAPLEIAERRFSRAPEVLLVWHGHSVARRFGPNFRDSARVMEARVS